MAMYVRPFSSPKSKTVTMFGWLSWAADWASRWNLRRKSGSAARAGAIVLMATYRLSNGSLAL